MTPVSKAPQGLSGGRATVRGPSRCRQGAASVELLIAIPLILIAIQGMLFLFGLNFSRQRTYAALPEVARRAQSGDRVDAFAPDEQSQCRIEGLTVRRTNSLDSRELSDCRRAGYAPPSDLMSVGFNARTTYRSPFLGRRVQMGTTYTENRLVPR